MHIVEELELKINSLINKINDLQNENHQLRYHIEELNDQNDQLKFNNENMLLNIDKALHLSSSSSATKGDDDILHQS